MRTRPRKLSLKQRLSPFTTPPWIKAPFLLVRYPAVLLAVAASVLILSVASAASPLFLSSVGNAALHDGVEAFCPWAVGLQLSTAGALSGTSASGGGVPALQRLGEADGVVHRSVDPLPHLGPATFTVATSALVAQRVGAAAGANPGSVRLVSRTDFLRHITRLQGDGTEPGFGSPIRLPSRSASSRATGCGCSFGTSP